MLVYRIGPGRVLADLRLVGWGVVPIVLQELIAYACNTLGWWYAFPSPPTAIGFARLMGIRLAGDAVNSVTPTATLGGEVIRVRLLRDRVAGTSAMASVAIAKLAQTVAQVLYIALGLVLLLDGSSLAPALRRDLLIVILVMGGIATALVFAQRRGAFLPLVAGLRAMGFARGAARLASVAARVDVEIAEFHAAGSRRFARSVACFFLAWAAGLIETALILYFLRIPLSFERVLAIEVLSIAIDGILFFVPAKAGTQEGGKVLIFTLLGLGPAQGLSFGILRRVRELAWAGVGLGLLSRLQAELGDGRRRPGAVGPGEQLRA